MPAPPVYLDECIDVALAPALRRRGFAVTVARDEGTAGASDEEQIEYAAQRGRVILTHNAIHFQRWHRVFIRAGRPHGGIIVIPETGPLSRVALRATLMLDWLGSQPAYHSRLFKWGQLQLLLTQGYRPPGRGYTEAELRHALRQG